jgi:hypothetical protein
MIAIEYGSSPFEHPTDHILIILFSSEACMILGRIESVTKFHAPGSRKNRLSPPSIALKIGLYSLGVTQPG